MWRNHHFSSFLDFLDLGVSLFSLSINPYYLSKNNMFISFLFLVSIQILDYTLTLSFHICNFLFYTCSFVSCFFFSNYIVLVRKVSTNLPEILDMVMPTVLLVIIIIASHFLYVAPIPWPLIRWAAALVLLIIFIVRAHIQNRWYVVVFDVFCLFFDDVVYFYFFLYCCTNK